MNNLKIMIVEDELIAAESLSLNLKKLDYEIAGIVTSGEKAILKIEETNPNLILMDIMLKGKIDGITTAEKIQKRWNIPIIYLTAYADNKTLERAKKTNSYGYLIKPYKLVDISTTITMGMSKFKEDTKIRENLKKQEKLNNLKTQALRTTSHDLRNPLTNILGYTELLRDYGDQITELQKEKYFDYIKYSVDEMNQSLEDLLLISKAEEGKLELDIEAFDLVSFINYTIHEYAANTDKHTINLICDQKQYNVFLDKKMLRHILNNLLSNAIKYSPKGGDIIVELTSKESQIILSISDQGIGIPKDHKDKLFKIFERANNVGSIKGNGLGLSIVYKAVKLHNGHIKVESKEGKGTKFIIMIPQEKLINNNS
jgi:signal transduction histidine kinase